MSLISMIRNVTSQLREQLAHVMPSTVYSTTYALCTPNNQTPIAMLHAYGTLPSQETSKPMHDPSFHDSHGVWHLMPLGQRGAAGASLEDIVGSGAKLLAPTLQLCATVRRFGEGGSLWPRTGNRALVGCGGEPGCDK